MAGGVTDGNAVNAAVTNAAFLFKNADDSTPNNVAFGSSGAPSASVDSQDLEVNLYQDLKTVATPASPAAGYLRVYPKSDGNIYKKTSVGVESQVGPSTQSVQSLTANTVLTSTAQVVFISGDNWALTLPAATNAGQTITIEKTDGLGANGITITRAGSDNIGPYTSVKAQTQGETFTLVADGVATWQIVGRRTITPWTAYTCTITGSTSNPAQGSGATKTALWRRVGDSCEIMFNYIQSNAGSAGSGAYLFSIPTNVSPNTSKTIASSSVGQGVIGAAGAGGGDCGIVQLYDTGNVAIAGITNGAGWVFTGSTRNALNNGSIGYSFKCEFAVTGWTE